MTAVSPEYFVGADEQTYFRIRARNGENVHTSEGYTTDTDARRGYSDFVRAVEGDTIPEAIPTEDGETWWVEGHVAPAVAVLAVIVEEAHLAGLEEAAGFFSGQVVRDRGTVPNWPEARLHLAEVVGNVEHIWLRQLDEGERMEIVGRTDEGAEAWTRILA